MPGFLKDTNWKEYMGRVRDQGGHGRFTLLIRPNHMILLCFFFLITFNFLLQTLVGLL